MLKLLLDQMKSFPRHRCHDWSRSCKLRCEFNAQLEVTGVILPRLTGDTRGGAALSALSSHHWKTNQITGTW